MRLTLRLGRWMAGLCTRIRICTGDGGRMKAWSGRLGNWPGCGARITDIARFYERMTMIDG